MVKKEKKKEDNFLLYKPVIKHSDWKKENDIVVLCFTHKKIIERMVRWLVKKPLESYMDLDTRGSSVWLAMDGKKNVYSIAQEMSEKYKSNLDEETNRLIRFLRHCSTRGWISFKKVV